MTRTLASLLVLALASACDNVPTMPDAAESDGGTSLDGGGDADVDAGPICTSHSDCDDGLYCNGSERCQPGPGANANGCVLAASPCESGEHCDEDTDSCEGSECPTDPSMRDADGDGHESMSCPGGDDCDDEDGNRYPGNAEICHGDGDPLDAHDEDCSDATVGELDADGDSYVSSVCGNGDVHGADCDDSDASVHPGVAETCNGADDDCDGTTDMAAAPLCPGGLCSAGHCDLDAWDRTFGGPSTDEVSDVTMDAAGNVYAVGFYSGTGVELGGGPVDSDGLDVFVVSYGPDGAFRWFADGLQLPGQQNGHDIAIGADGTVFVTAALGSEVVDLGSGDRGPYASVLIALSASSGEYQWDADLPGTSVDLSAIPSSDDVVVIGQKYVMRFPSTTSTPLWMRDFTGMLPSLYSGVASASDVYVAGRLNASPFRSNFIRAFSLADGADGDELAITGSAEVTSMAVDSMGRLDVVGWYMSDLDVGGTTITHDSASSRNGLVLALDASLAHRWHRGLPGATPFGVATDSSDGVRVVGSFSQPVNFGSGFLTPGGMGAVAVVAAFYAAYSSTNMPLIDRGYGAQGESDAFSVAVGPADSTVIGGYFGGDVDFGSGTHSTYEMATTGSAGRDAFIVRLAN